MSALALDAIAPAMQQRLQDVLQPTHLEVLELEYQPEAAGDYLL